MFFFVVIFVIFVCLFICFVVVIFGGLGKRILKIISFKVDSFMETVKLLKLSSN